VFGEKNALQMNKDEDGLWIEIEKERKRKREKNERKEELALNFWDSC
jgi:hypothetical protein